MKIVQIFVQPNLFSFIFIILISLLNFLYANNSNSQDTIRQAKKNYESVYHIIQSRVVPELAYKIRSLSLILHKLGHKDITVNIYNSPLDSPSALCYPSRRQIFVSLELLAIINTDDEIAFILAHELSHILNNDNYSDKEILAFYKATQAFNHTENMDEIITLEEEKQLLSMRYNKEYNADNSALHLIDNKYSSSGSITILSQLGQSLLDKNSDTHPAISMRINKIKNLSSYKENRTPITKNPIFKAQINLNKYARGRIEIDKEAVQKALNIMDEFYKNN